MNPLAFLYIRSSNLSVPLLWLVNVLVVVICALILWYIFKWVAAEFEVPAKIVKLIGILIFLFLFLSLFVGCTSVHHRNGSPWIRTSSNVAHIEAHSGNESVVIDGIDNSSIHRAAGDTVTKTGLAVAESGILGFFGKFF